MGPDAFNVKLSCLFILLLFSLAGCTPEPSETDLLVPVIFSAMPAGLTRTAFHTKSIEVRIKGTPDRVQRTGGLNLSYLVDLYADLASDPAGGIGSIAAGFYFVPVIKDRLALPQGIEILQITPEFITVQLDRQVRRHLPITVVVTGEPAVGYEVERLNSEPPSVDVVGPESVVNKLTHLQTNPVDISAATGNFKSTGSLDLDLDGMALSVSTSLVTVGVTLRETIETVVFPDIAVTTRNGPPEVLVVPSEIKITLKGPANGFKTTVSADDFQVYIDLQGLSSGVYVRPAVINVPVGLMLVDALPKNFTITVK